MARHREFNEADVLDRAMRVFWQKGFEAASVQDLVEATEINRASMYATFGDKKGLFEAAVQHYLKNVSSERMQILMRDGDGYDNLVDFFDDLLEFSTGEGRKLGCLLTNSAIELAPHDAVWQSVIAQRLENVENIFAKCVEHAQQTGKMRTDMTAKQIGRFFMNTLQGIRVLTRADTPRETLSDIIKVAFAGLKT